MSALVDLATCRVQESLDALAKLRDLTQEIAATGTVLQDVYRHGGKALFVGNGGSAADAQHLAAELVVRYAKDRPGLPAMALTVNSSIITAASNDYGYNRVFDRQVESLGQSGDALVAISTSGTSPNVLNAVRTARRMSLHTVGLTGEGGGALRAEVDHCICVPSSDTPRIQECHILIGHIWCEMIEAIFSDFPDAPSGPKPNRDTGSRA